MGSPKRPDDVRKQTKSAEIRSGSNPLSNSSSHLDFTQPLEQRLRGNASLTDTIPDIERATFGRPDRTKENKRSLREIYASSLEEAGQAITAFKAFRDRHHVQFQTEEKQLATSFISNDAALDEQFENYLDKLQDYQSRLYDQHAELEKKISQMRMAKKALDHTNPRILVPEQAQLDAQFTRNQEGIRDLKLFSHYNARLTNRIAAVRAHRDLMPQHMEVANHNQEIAETLGPIINPDKQTQHVNTIKTLRNSIGDFSEKYDIEKVETTEMIITRSQELQDNPYHHKIKLLENKRDVIKNLHPDNASTIEQEFQEQIQSVRQLEILHKDLDPFLLVERYDLIYPTMIEAQISRITTLDQTMTGAANRLALQSAPWDDGRDSPLQKLSSAQQDQTNQLIQTFQDYYKIRETINEFQRLVSEDYSDGTVDGFLGKHQLVGKDKPTTHHADIFDNLGNSACGHITTLTLAEMFGADLNDPTTRKKILQLYPESTRNNLGLNIFEIKDGLNQCEYIPIKFKTFYLDLTTDIYHNETEKKLGIKRLTVTLEHLQKFVHRRIYPQQGKMFAPVVFVVGRTTQDETHFVILQAINKKTDQVRYYSNEKKVTTNLKEVVELFKDGRRHVEMVVFDGYKDDESSD